MGHQITESLDGVSLDDAQTEPARILYCRHLYCPQQPMKHRQTRSLTKMKTRSSIHQRQVTSSRQQPSRGSRSSPSSTLGHHSVPWVLFIRPRMLVEIDLVDHDIVQWRYIFILYCYILLFSFGRCTKALHPKTLRCATEGFFLDTSWGVLSTSADVGDRFFR